VTGGNTVPYFDLGFRPGLTSQRASGKLAKAAKPEFGGVAPSPRSRPTFLPHHTALKDDGRQAQAIQDIGQTLRAYWLQGVLETIAAADPDNRQVYDWIDEIALGTPLPGEIGTEGDHTDESA
jgi:hypothetical protein